MLPVKLDKKIREGIQKTIPLINEIQNVELREQIIDAWALSLQINNYTKIEEMPGSGMPEAESLGDQSMHINAVAYNALCIYDNLEKVYNMKLGLDRDMLIAAAVIHDVGKPYEYNEENRTRWAKDYKLTGAPNIRHPVYGVYIGIAAGLPEELVHVIACHSPEGRFVKRSGYATIVHYADESSWFSLASLLDLNIPKL